MFKRVLLCYDGTEAGRRALRRGAELAILLGAHVSVLSIATDGVANAAVLAGAAGQACIVDEPAQYRKLLSESIDCGSHRSRPLSAPERRLVVVCFQASDIGRQGQVLHFWGGQRRGRPDRCAKMTHDFR